jgi:DNA-binding MarR family transcriptional regulator
MPMPARKPVRWVADAPRRTAPTRMKTQGRKVIGRKDVERPIDLGGLNSHLGYFIRRAQVWVFQDFIRVLKVLDISPAQYSVLLIIAANPGLSQAELARTLAIERARLVRMLHRLDKRDLTRRLQSSSDGRTHALRLTPKGQETLRRAQVLVAQHEARLIDKIGVEPYETMKSILRFF